MCCPASCSLSVHHMCGTATMCNCVSVCHPATEGRKGIEKDLLQNFFHWGQVAHLKRGIFGWHLAELPFEGSYDSAGVGRTPSVVRQTPAAPFRNFQLKDPFLCEKTQKNSCGVARPHWSRNARHLSFQVRRNCSLMAERRMSLSQLTWSTVRSHSRPPDQPPLAVNSSITAAAAAKKVGCGLLIAEPDRYLSMALLSYEAAAAGQH